MENDLVEIGLKAGYGAATKTLSREPRPEHRIYFSRNQFAHYHEEPEVITDYHDLVYCFSVPNEIGVFRRNNKVFIMKQCHEGWYGRNNGLNVGKAMQRLFEENGRKDFSYIGHIEGDVELRTPNISKHAQGPILRILHPGGGNSYAKSYRTQRWAASLQGGEKPQVALIGHYHKEGYFLERNIHCVLAACTSDQSIFMRKLMIPAEVGYHIAEIKIGEDGAILSFKIEFVHFFDRSYYQNYEHV